MISRQLSLFCLTLLPMLSSTALAGDVRPRGGVSGSIIHHRPGPSTGVGFAARAGAQINPKIGVYGEFGAVAGIGFGGSTDGNTASASARAAAYSYLAPMFEYDANNLFVAGGPMIGFGGWAGTAATADSSGAGSSSSYAVGGTPFGAQARVGFIGGSVRENGGLRGFHMALDVKLLNGGVAEVTANSAGEAAVSVGDRAWGVTPTLMLGYEWR